MAAGRPITVLHLAPHPDDESIAVPATLLALRAAGHRVVDLACGLGRPEHAARRRRELEEACRRGGLELLIHDPPLELSLVAGDDLGAAQRTLTATLARLIESERVDLVVAPSPHDGHPGHEAVGRAAVAVAAGDAPARLWLWGLWADLPLPTLYAGFDDARLAQVLHMLEAHEGELARTDYRALVAGRAAANRVLGAERVFGFGSEARGPRYAELLTEAVVRDGRWWATAARRLDPTAPLPAATGPLRPLDAWLRAPSFAEQLRAHAHSGVSHSTPSGGIDSTAECDCPIQGMSSASTPPWLPTSEPP